MQCFVLFKHKDPALSLAEVRALLSGSVTEASAEYCVVDGALPYERLVMSKCACLLHARGSLEQVLKQRLPAYKSFAVRATRLEGFHGDRRAVERELGQAIKGRVDLAHGTVVRAFCGKEIFVTEELWKYSSKRFADREVIKRPAFNPSSLSPKLARLLLNLANARESVLDPFCGVGGILLEAGALGIKATGVEIDGHWADYARKNAEHYGFGARVETADFLEWKGGKFECIVTDLPYGKSSGLFGKKLDDLYSKAFEKFHEHSDKCVVMGPKDLTAMLAKAGWKTSVHASFHVHRSMARNVHACEAAK
jgi:tRNA (guanine10-N2)-dimethyltransferase